MKTKHTPGSWMAYVWEETGTDLWHIRSVKTFTDLIATVYRWMGCINKREAEANAKLIAAAPELLEAIQYYFDVLEEVRGETWADKPDHVLKKFLEAVKKATG